MSLLSFTISDVKKGLPEEGWGRGVSLFPRCLLPFKSKAKSYANGQKKQLNHKSHYSFLLNDSRARSLLRLPRYIFLPLAGNTSLLSRRTIQIRARGWLIQLPSLRLVASSIGNIALTTGLSGILAALLPRAVSASIIQIIAKKLFQSRELS